MADLSSYIAAMNEARTGRDLRDPIVSALNELSTTGKDTPSLNNHDSSYFAKQSDMSKLLPMDRYVRRNSTKLVTGGGIIEAIGDLDDFDWGE